MLPSEVPSGTPVSSATKQEILDLYTEVMSELMVRGRDEHRDHWGPEPGPPGPLASVDEEALLRLYRSVHAEMMLRERERPGMWEPVDDLAEGHGAPP